MPAFVKRQAVTISTFLKFVRIPALIFLGTTCLGLAQEDPNVEMVADEIVFIEGGKVLSSGNVKITYGNTLLQASKVEFDEENYTFFGPLYISDPSGTRVLADFAELSQEKQTGAIEGLRILYQNKLQITSGSVRREGGNLIFFNNLITTCNVCKAGETPLWYFQADSITVSKDGGRIYLKNVSFKIWDIPILYLPWFSIGSPAAGRQSGFLTPEVKYSSGKGIEARVPYYHVLNEQTDITLALGRTAAKKPGYDLEFRNFSKSGWLYFEAAHPFREENLGLFQKDLVLKGVQRPDETSEISFLVTDTSADNISYPIGIFPDGNKLTFLEAKKSLPIGQLTFRAININPFTSTRDTTTATEMAKMPPAEKPVLAENSFERLVSLGFATRDLMPNSRPRLTFDLKFNSIVQNHDKGPKDPNNLKVNANYPQYHNFKNASLVGRYSNSIILDSGFKSSTTIFLQGEIYDQDLPAKKGSEETPEPKQRIKYGRAMVINNLSFPMVLTGTSNFQLLTPFIQTVYSQDNDKTLPARPRPFQVIDRSKFLANHQDISESWIRDGREVSLGLKYYTSFQDNDFDLVFGKTIMSPDDKTRAKPQYIHAGDQKSHYFAEGILALGEKIELTSLFVGDNKFRVVSNYSKVSLMHNGYEAGISYGWLRGNEDEDDKTVEKVLAKSATSYIEVPLSDQWTGFANASYDFLGHATREFEVGARYHHNCVTLDLSAKRTLATDLTAKSKPDYSIGFSLVGFTSASTLSRKNCN